MIRFKDKKEYQAKYTREAAYGLLLDGDLIFLSEAVDSGGFSVLTAASLDFDLTPKARWS